MHGEKKIVSRIARFVADSTFLRHRARFIKTKRRRKSITLVINKEKAQQREYQKKDEKRDKNKDNVRHAMTRMMSCKKLVTIHCQTKHCARDMLSDAMCFICNLPFLVILMYNYSFFNFFFR